MTMPTVLVSSDTCLLLELPPEIDEQVRRLRWRYGVSAAADPVPVHITLTGSNGVGPLCENQELDAVLERVAAMGAAVQPIETSFGPVRRFPGAAVYYLSVADERPFLELHQRVVNSGLRFAASPFAYAPHCTLLSSSQPLPPEREAALLAEQVTGSFVIETLSVWSIHPRPSRRLGRFRLGSGVSVL